MQFFKTLCVIIACIALLISTIECQLLTKRYCGGDLVDLMSKVCVNEYNGRSKRAGKFLFEVEVFEILVC